MFPTLSRFEFIIAYFVGLTSGLHSASWGAFKDTVFEGYEPKKFFRSIIAGLTLGIFAFLFLKLNNVQHLNLGLFFLFVVTLERLFTETFKIFFREEDQTNYRIPSKLHLFGRIVHNNFLRYSLGLGYIALAALLFYLPKLIKVYVFNHALTSIFYGVLAGFIASALGGALKDAPFEGFDLLKFLRSPIIGGFWGLVLSFFTNDYSFLIFACVGAERITIEFYKTFVSRKPPGKFKFEKPVFKSWVVKRNRFVLPYFATWLLFIILLLL
ncbi:hypothetical protein J7L02_03705 [Candidatus Woesearchaeota archaeon]|nr:hypothetical protein [Candidatus Woesearchaeota archaeon]